MNTFIWHFSFDDIPVDLLNRTNHLLPKSLKGLIEVVARDHYVSGETKEGRESEGAEGLGVEGEGFSEAGTLACPFLGCLLSFALRFIMKLFALLPYCIIIRYNSL